MEPDEAIRILDQLVEDFWTIRESQQISIAEAKRIKKELNKVIKQYLDPKIGVKNKWV